MLVFPNCKINLGLNVTQKREDGYHNIETVFYPINWCDALEVIDNTDSKEPILFTQSGILVSGKKEDNLIYKAWQIISETNAIPPIKVHLHKNLPMGAGLGGGSSDAAFFINLIDKKYNLGISLLEKTKIASKLGSDCGFFIKNEPVLAKGKGDEFSDITIDLSNYYILLIFPDINSNTKDAYNGIVPKIPQNDLKNTIENSSIKDWKTNLKNDFEETMFIKYPLIKKIKEELYEKGAIYACMSGSGSSVFGIFDNKPNVNFNSNYRFYLQTPSPKIL